MLNRVILVGRITKDPELKRTQTNIAVVSFTLAIDRQFTNEQGERQADFIQCVVWRKQAENVAQFVRKGALLGIDGRIQTRTYEGPNGDTRYVTEVLCDSVQFLESKKSQEQTSPQDFESNTYQEEDPFVSTGKSLAAEEDLPF
ncbi:MAG: single-stranded DNA-binding protein [Paracholeplasma sp.]|jgi:single-strand DNA-binding protein|uniref:Single-stranded DNA-binding protein n=1 Tax=Acholeplasma brassicae TaxID=61635 RepID=U4KR14_9MOLU|nr:MULTISPECIES: single-stranded DNA-binding protein [Paracholeplasma]MDY3195600.1 single-stranded DNA-binding protein [Paracholeplasma sp.]CCV65338.1 Single-stranded DNA-binding protein [Paracholeplasma brassicae]HBT59626.1 single-stranded DNA-binding protein [Acholeplasmataceae bacterium]